MDQSATDELGEICIARRSGAHAAHVHAHVDVEAAARRAARTVMHIRVVCG